MGSARLSWFWEERVPGRERAGVRATPGQDGKAPTCSDQELGRVGLPCPGPREAGTGRRAAGGP